MEIFKKELTIEKVEGSQMTFILYDDSIFDRDFEKVLVAGIDYTNFLKNPVMLLHHQSRSLPIGKWVNIRIEGTRLVADAVFDETSLDPEDLIVIDKIQKGFIKAVSIGFMPKAAPVKFNPPPNTPEAYALDITWRDAYLIWEKTELYEVSIVTLPSNPNAIRIKSYEKTGAAISQANKDIIKECHKMCNDHMNDNMKSFKKMAKTHSEVMTKICQKLNMLTGEDEDQFLDTDSVGATAEPLKMIEDKLNHLLELYEKNTVVTEDGEEVFVEPTTTELTIKELSDFLLNKEREQL